ncbi:hypothetical protein GCM10023188_12680 [Pontibacter saemangeumensis]|uniref:Uncharacterized protein n=1 Tax=Pontibacter saemangeumensis TaxID=1084525 RepID=A0ABP8LHS5_9BACT
MHPVLKRFTPFVLLVNKKLSFFYPDFNQFRIRRKRLLKNLNKKIRIIKTLSNNLYITCITVNYLFPLIRNKKRYDKASRANSNQFLQGSSVGAPMVVRCT